MGSAMAEETTGCKAFDRRQARASLGRSGKLHTSHATPAAAAAWTHTNPCPLPCVLGQGRQRRRRGKYCCLKNTRQWHVAPARENVDSSIFAFLVSWGNCLSAEALPHVLCSTVEHPWMRGELGFSPIHSLLELSERYLRYVFP